MVVLLLPHPIDRQEHRLQGKSRARTTLIERFSPHPKHAQKIVATGGKFHKLGPAEPTEQATRSLRELQPSPFSSFFGVRAQDSEKVTTTKTKPYPRDHGNQRKLAETF